MSLREILAVNSMLASGKLKIKLDANNVNVQVTFKYNKLKGTITVLYVDEVGNEIADRTVLTDLDLGVEYTIEPKEIPGYKLAEE